MFFYFYKILFFLADLLKIQRKSFYTFLTKGLARQLRERNVFLSPMKKMKIVIFFQYYQLLEPSYNIHRAILQSKTFSCKLFIPVPIYISDDHRKSRN
uniref:RNA polymerase b-subunit n=1 Tax=Pseudoderbesia arbuscula TaxID=2320809 RepID=A0A386AYN9_9CHLO|nr:RNA polymerase b-subunit [Pseudoderbesia arbuscula]